MATMTLTWKDLNIGEDGFNIYRSESPMDINNMPVPLATVASNIGSYDDTTGTIGSYYYYRIGVVRGTEERLSPELYIIFDVVTVNDHDIFGDGSAVATYQFDGDATDLGGTYNGTWTASEAYSTGKFNQAASFDGTGYIDGAPAMGVPEMSVSFWVRNPSNSAFGFNRCMIQQNDFFVFINANGTGDFIRTSSIFSTAAVDTWHHYVMNVYSDDTFEVYMDNSLMNLTSGTSSTLSVYGGGAIGNSSDGGGYNFSGDIDQFRIFNRPLTASEVDILYNEV